MTTKTCRACRGTGKQRDTTNSLIWGFGVGLPIYPKTKTCSRCSGTGQVAK